MKKIFAINGSASADSSNEKLLLNFASVTQDIFRVKIFNQLKSLPHFDPILSIENPPEEVIHFRKEIEQADGVIICTPEYIFSIPSGLKNAMEWCVSTTVFSDKPMGIITASAHGQKGHEELQLIMKTVMAKFSEENTLLIQGIKGKINKEGKITDEKTFQQLQKFVDSYKILLEV